MKFCYLDESGTGSEPFAVMVGIIADSHRMHITKREWAALLVHLSSLVGRNLDEIHTRDLYSGNSPWRTLDGNSRAELITAIFNWLTERKHQIVYTAVNKSKYDAELKVNSKVKEVGSLWCFMALHICLAIQKYSQTLSSNKGHAILIFDNEKMEADNFINKIRRPFSWTDTYYDRKTREDQLNQIVDIPYFVDSRHIALIQLADFVSYFLRRYIEIKEKAVPSAYENELQQVEGWVKMALDRSIGKSIIYPTRGRCDCADLFYRCAPSCLL